MSLDLTSGSFPPAAAASLPLQHFHRYQLAARLARGRVLDLGCGSGYGTGMLTRHAEEVWGVDASAEAVAYASWRFAAANARYLVSAAQRLPFPGGCFDLVTCFGVLDGEDAIDRVLQEGRRVLAASGVLLLSVPRPLGGEAVDLGDFTGRIAERFAHVRLFGLRQDGGPELALWRPSEAVSVRPDPSRLMAVCSHRELSETVPLHRSGVSPADLARYGERLLRDHAQRESETRLVYEKVVEDLRAKIEAFDSRIRRLGREVEQARGEQLAGLQGRLAEAEWRWQTAEQERDRLTLELVAIHRSKMWRAWMAYHRLRGTAMAPAALFGRAWRETVEAFARVREQLGRAGRRVAAAAAWRLRAAGRTTRAAFQALRRRAAIHSRRLLFVPAHALGRLYLSVSTGLLRRRARVLRRRRPAALGERRVWQGPYGRKPRVLLVSPYPIHPTDHGGAVRIFNLIKRIAPHVELHLLVLSRADDDGPQRRALAPFCQSVHFHHWRPGLRPDLWGLEPPGAQLFQSEELAARLRKIADDVGIDVLQLEYTELGQYAGRVPGVRTVLTEIDLTFRSRHRRRAAGFHRRYHHDRIFGWSWGDFMRQLRYEVAVCSRTHQVHVMSSDDGAYLASFLPDGDRRVRVIPNAVDCRALRPPRGGTARRGALFVGNFQHLPNVDAFDYLIEEVWPEVRRLRPNAELTVVGAHAPERVLAHDGSDGLRVVGAVPEVLPFYQRHRVLLAPIRAGSGTRLKILEALACGLPVVSTRIGAEGIDGRPGEHFLLAETPREIAAQVVRLLEDDTFHRDLATRGRALVEELYDWDASAEQLLEAYRELLPEPDRFPSEEEDERPRRRATGAPEISVVIPTLNGGELLGRTLEAVLAQRTRRRFEVIAIDSDSSPEHRAILDRYPVRVETIDRAEFNHGLTRDRGAELARGEVLVFLNQDAVPSDRRWLDRLTEPLFGDDRGLAAVQGGILEMPDPDSRFYWDSCGHRFYFTRESGRWIERFGGIGFSTVNAALRREVWHRHPFGFAPIMEDKQWQRAVVEAGYRVVARGDAAVFHTHDYDFDGLVRRCVSEGFGWRHLGEPYRLRDLVRDLARPRVYADLARGLAEGRVRSAAELLFPWLRPLMLYRGSRFSRSLP